MIMMELSWSGILVSVGSTSTYTAFIIEVHSPKVVRIDRRLSEDVLFVLLSSDKGDSKIFDFDWEAPCHRGYGEFIRLPNIEKKINIGHDCERSAFFWPASRRKNKKWAETHFRWKPRYKLKVIRHDSLERVSGV
jgi:hypothetical protein